MLATPQRSSVLVVEAERMVARDLELALQAAGYHVPAVAASGPEALALIERARPDLALVDIGLAGPLDGIEVVRRLAPEACPAIVYLTAHTDDATLARAEVTSPFGYVVKPFDPRQLLCTVLLALGRSRADLGRRDAENACYREALRRIGAIVAEAGLGGATPAASVPGLSQREQEVVRALLESGRVPSIARSLYISPHTVRNHLKSVFRKLGVSNQAELIERLRARR